MNKRIRKKQLKKIGKYVPYSDIWSLDITIAKFILPRLKIFREVVDCYPSNLNSIEEWYEILDKMIEAFYFIAEKQFNTKYEETEKDKQIVEEGLDLFREYYHGLWW